MTREWVAFPRPRAFSRRWTVSKDVVLVLLLAVAGFLVGGVYTTWKTAKVMAGVLGLAALLAIGGAIAWYVS